MSDSKAECQWPDMEAIAPPWDYNASAWRQRIPIVLMALVAALISVYLGLYQWRLVDSVWDPVFGSEQTADVIGSKTAHRMHKWFVIPDAIFGAVAYLGDAVFGLAGCTRRWQYRPWLVILFGIDVIPLGIVSIVLVLIQTFVLGQWCFLCLVTAFISCLLIYWAYDEVWSSLAYLYRVWRGEGLRALWRATFGYPVPNADRYAGDAAAAGG